MRRQTEGAGHTGHVGPRGALLVRGFGFYSKWRKGPTEGFEQKRDGILPVFYTRINGLQK